MLRVTVLGSGSRGNAIMIDGTEGSILIDVGFGPRSMVRRLREAGRHPQEIGAVLLTHEHRDHASGAAAAQRRWQWPLYASPGTAHVLSEGAADAPLDIRLLADAGHTVLNGFQVETYAVPHDARDCRAFVITDVASGNRCGVAIDLGRVPDQLLMAFARLDVLVIESNHDEQMLAQGPYPRALQQRIRGGFGHLSNDATARLVRSCAHPALFGVVLTHLSETNNIPALAVSCTQAALRIAGCLHTTVFAAAQGSPSAPVEVNGTPGRRPSGHQLVLSL